jgi:hypothetical protein
METIHLVVMPYPGGPPGCAARDYFLSAGIASAAIPAVGDFIKFEETTRRVISRTYGYDPNSTFISVYLETEKAK